MGYVDFFTFLIPLYGLSLGLGVSEIGVFVGARSILALRNGGIANCQGEEVALGPQHPHPELTTRRPVASAK
jgi:hypothetical protein